MMNAHERFCLLGSQIEFPNDQRAAILKRPITAICIFLPPQPTPPISPLPKKLFGLFTTLLAHGTTRKWRERVGSSSFLVSFTPECLFGTRFLLSLAKKEDGEEENPKTEKEQ